MRLWKVDVVGTFAANKQLRRHRWKLLLEAEDGSAAMEAGRSWVDGHAPPDKRWIDITAMGAATVELPIELS